MKRFKLLIVIAAANLVFMGCGPISSDETGSILIHLSDDVFRRTLDPPVVMEVASYDIIGAGPLDGSFELLGVTDSTVVVDGLTPGSWTVTVQGVNPDGVVIATGSIVVEVLPGRVGTATVVLVPIEGDGWLELEISWPVGALSNPSVEAHLISDVADQILPFDVQLGASRSVYPDPDEPAGGNVFPSGYYLLTIKVFDDGNQVWDWVEAVRILAGETTEGEYELTLSDINEGQLELTIQEDLQNPILIELTGFQQALLPGTSMTVSAVPSEPVDGYQWFVNGDPIDGATSNVITLGGDLTNGFYRLIVVAFNGRTLSSVGAQFAVGPQVSLEWTIYDPMDVPYPTSTTPQTSTIAIDTFQWNEGTLSIGWCTSDSPRAYFLYNETIDDPFGWRSVEMEAHAGAVEPGISIDTIFTGRAVLNSSTHLTFQEIILDQQTPVLGSEEIIDNTSDVDEFKSVTAINDYESAVLFSASEGVSLWGRGPDVVTISESGVLTSNRSLVADSSENLHMVFLDSGVLVYGSAINGNVTTSTVDTGYDYAALAVGPDDGLYICAHEESADQLVLLYFDGVSWTEEPLTEAGSGAYEPAIAVSESGNVSICYRSDRLSYIVGTPGHWAEYAVGLNEQGYLPSVDVDPLGFAHVSYWDQSTNGLKYATNRPQ